MNRTIVILIVTLAAGAFATTGMAQTRHDERPHGYDASVAAEQKASTVKGDAYAVGPRPHDAVRRVVKPAPVIPPVAAPDRPAKIQGKRRHS